MHILKYYFANETCKQHGSKLGIYFKKTNFLTDSTMSGKKVLLSEDIIVRNLLNRYFFFFSMIPSYISFTYYRE